MAKKKKKAGKKMESIVVSSKAKAALKKAGCNVSADALDGLNNVLYWYIDQAAKRTKANGRKTVRAHDFVI